MYATKLTPTKFKGDKPSLTEEKLIQSKKIKKIARKKREGTDGIDALDELEDIDKVSNWEAEMRQYD
mgnify:CR=1 FL=1